MHQMYYCYESSSANTQSILWKIKVTLWKNDIYSRARHKISCNFNTSHSSRTYVVYEGYPNNRSRFSSPFVEKIHDPAQSTTAGVLHIL